MSAESARLFVALELPASVKASLAQWAEAELDGIDGLRRLHPEAMHLTLCFLGWKSGGDVERVSGVLRGLADAPAMTMTPRSVLWLPRRRPGVVAIKLAGAVDEDAGHLAALQSGLARGLLDAGLYEPEKRPFLAHITVARVRRGARVCPSDLPGPEPAPFSLSILTLFRSHLGRGGARYEPLTRVSLGS